MNWKQELYKNAVAIAFPQWEWLDSDVVSIEIDGGDRGFHTDVTFDPGLDATIIVNVHRADEKLFLINNTTVCQKVYAYDDMHQFWNELMNANS